MTPPDLPPATLADLRAAALARLEELGDAAAGLGLAVAERGLDPQGLAAVLSAADGACKLLEAARDALPSGAGAGAGEAAADAS